MWAVKIALNVAALWSLGAFITSDVAFMLGSDSTLLRAVLVASAVIHGLYREIL